jgi:hypothetical protein
MSGIKNRWWFEQDLLRINNICVEKLCAENDLNTLYSYLNIVAQLSIQAMESGCLLFWTKSVVDHIATITDGGKTSIKKRVKKYNMKKFEETI